MDAAGEATHDAVLPVLVEDQIDSLVHVLDLIRTESAATRPELSRISGYGRTLISQRLAQLQLVGLVNADDVRHGVRGRAPTLLKFNAQRAHILVALVEARSVTAALTDLSGEVLEKLVEEHDPSAEIGEMIDTVDNLFDELCEGVDRHSLWGIGVGLQAPVNYTTGRPAGSAITPLWENYPVRDRLESRFGVPVWVDNDVNLMAYGYLRMGNEQEKCDMLFVRVGAGIGVGILSEGRLHRGVTGAAGEIAHTRLDKHSGVKCYCGKTGCLVAVAGGNALLAAAQEAIEAGSPSSLSSLVDAGTPLTVESLAQAATQNDPLAVNLIIESARALGAVLADLVNFYNPERIILGGLIPDSNSSYLAAVREEVFGQAHPLATSPLTIDEATFDDNSSLHGAALMVVDELLSREGVALWIKKGTPVGMLH